MRRIRDGMVRRYLKVNDLGQLVTWVPMQLHIESLPFLPDLVLPASRAAKALPERVVSHCSGVGRALM